MMEIALIIAVVVIAALGWMVTGRYSDVLRRHAVQLEGAKQQLEELRLGQRVGSGELARQAEVAGQQRARTADLDSRLADLRSELTTTLDRHDGMLARSSSQADELEAAAAEVQAKFRQAVQQISAELESDRRASAALGVELRQAMTMLQAELADTGNRQHQSVLEHLQRLEHKAVTRADRAEHDLVDLGRRLGDASDSAGQWLAGIRRDIQAHERGAEKLRGDTHSLRASVQELDTGLAAVRAVARWQIDQELTGNPDLVIAGGVYADQPASVDILSVFYDEACRDLSAKIISRGSWGPSGGTFYLSWPKNNHYSPRQFLWQLLRACRDDEGKSAPGRVALRSLLAAMSQTASAAIQLGPLIVVCTPGVYVGGVLERHAPATLEPLAADPETLLGRLDPNCRLDLTPLAIAVS